MLQQTMQTKGLEAFHAGERRGVALRQGKFSVLCEKTQSAGEMQRRIEELLLLAEFNAAIGTIHDPNLVCSAACNWMAQVLKWDVLSVSCTEGEAGNYRYHVLYLDEHLSEICPGLAAGANKVTVKTKRKKAAWSEYGNNVISVCFPDRSGVLAVSRRSVQESQFSDELLAGIAESLSRSLFNAREYSRLKTLCMRDHLTGLYNRRVFETMLEVEAGKRSTKPFSLLLVDLDNFKTINDTFGHGTGDEVLVYVAEMLRLSFRKSDIPARYGGDEFAVLLPETPLESAQRVAERFRASVSARPSAFGARDILPTVSVGIAVVEDRAKVEVAQMVAEADRALYRAKSPGKNRVCASLMNQSLG